MLARTSHPATGPEFHVRGSRAPPTLEDLEDSPCVKVRQPFADLLVSGAKDCENRTWCLSSYPGWVLIVSSKSVPTKSMMADANDRLRATSHKEYSDDARGKFVLGHILGVVYVEGCYLTLPWKTVWHNPPDIAWMVTDAWRFEKPIPLREDDGFQTQVFFRNRQVQYSDAVKAELAKLNVA